MKAQKDPAEEFSSSAFYWAQAKTSLHMLSTVALLTYVVHSSLSLTALESPQPKQILKALNSWQSLKIISQFSP